MQTQRIDALSYFQSEALSEILACADRKNANDEALIIAGDTGAGKTEAFLFPILLDIAGEPAEQRSQPGVRAVLVYPRIRLARNQLRRILRYTQALASAGGPRISVGIQNGDTPQSVKRLAESRGASGGERLTLSLLESCIRCGEVQYRVAADDPALDTGCPTLTCPNCGHVIDTLYVTQAALKCGAPELLIITDVSLSQWLTRESYSHLWGLWSGEAYRPPRYLILDEIHLYEQLRGAHIARLIKRFQARVRLVYQSTGEAERYPLVIGVSATLNNERAFLAKLLDIPQTDPHMARLRVVKPRPDDLEITAGRERYIFIKPRRLSPTAQNPQYRVNDQTAAIQFVMTVMHNLKRGKDWRGLAFFDSINDLRQFRHNYDAGGIPEDRAGTANTPAGVVPDAANQRELWRIRTDGRPANSRGSQNSHAQCGGTCQERLRNKTLGECPHFRQGDCWIPAQAGGWNQQLEVADAVYAGTAARLDGKDLIPTSPSLEVGYDDDAIQLVYQHKAPSSAASFIQRRGRAGRSPDDSPIIVTMLWPYRSGDAFYFYHPQALYDPIFDDAPLNAGNFNVQRTHALLAFFDLLACLRRQNIDGLRDDPTVPDFTQAGWADLRLSPESVHSHSWLPNRFRPGEDCLVITHGQTRRQIWLSGKQLDYVQVQGSTILMTGWLAMEKQLTFRTLGAAWRHLGASQLFERYVDTAGVMNAAFKRHRTNPFLIPLSGSEPSRLISRFGNRDYHSSHDPVERANWLRTYRYIDWMLQGNEEATTLIVHYPRRDGGAGLADEPPEHTVEVTYALTELLPGNVSYRLRTDEGIHWTPVPRDGESTFRYPEEPASEDAEISERSTTRWVEAYLPKPEDIASKPESIFGVPRYLDQRFRGLPFIRLRRLQVARFSAPNESVSGEWYFDPAEGRALSTAAGEVPPAGAFRISRRSSATASSVIIPYVASASVVAHRNLEPPLDSLFSTIDGYLEAGTGMLGYTRVFYEMTINVKGEQSEQSRTLQRLFYGHRPQRDEEDRPLPTLVGFAVETHGVAFEVNPAVLRRTVEAIQADHRLRLLLRRKLALYSFAPYAVETNEFLKTLIDTAEVMIDYWLHEVVPQSEHTPRPLSSGADRAPALDYYLRHRTVRAAEQIELERIIDGDLFFPRLNSALERAFKTGRLFQDYLESVVLHSLASLLKNLMAQLGGVRSDQLVAYADLPVLDQVDRSINPRILIMDTIDGGSGAVAQAYERLELGAVQASVGGSLWWLLQRDLGQCPIANGEALVRSVLARTSEDQILKVQADQTPEALDRLLTELDLQPAPEARQALGRVLFSDTNAGTEVVNPALIVRELILLQNTLDERVPFPYPPEAVARRAALELNAERYPAIDALRSALVKEQPEEIVYELGIQLLNLYERVCEDGCPVCNGTDSDIEHYYLAPLLQSRLVLGVLREVLQAAAPQASCIAALAEQLRSGQAVRVMANPGSLGNHVRQDLGLAVVANVDVSGQISSSAALPIDQGRLSEALDDPAKWSHPNGPSEPPRYPLADDRYVRTREEYLVAIALDEANLAFQLDSRLPFRDSNGQTRSIHPDFYLYEHNIYLECWDGNPSEYVESREYKETAYRHRNIVPVHIDKSELELGKETFLAAIRARTAAAST